MTLFYISFATDEGFRGVTVVNAIDAASAFTEATRLDLNPGGEAAIFEIPDDIDSEGRTETHSYLNRLVGKDELLANGAKRHGDYDSEERDVIEQNATKVCGKCNI